MLNCIIDNEILLIDNTDSRQEWCEYNLHCPKCFLKYTEYIRYKHQSHLIDSDILYVHLNNREINTEKLTDEEYELLKNQKVPGE